MVFNRKEYSFAAGLQTPEYLDVGFRVKTADPSTEAKGSRSIMIDILNNNVPEVSLIGLAKYVEIQFSSCLSSRLNISDLLNSYH